MVNQVLYHLFNLKIMKELNWYDFIPEHKDYFRNIFIKDITLAQKIVNDYQAKGGTVERFILERLNEEE